MDNSDLSSMITKIVQNPEFASLVQELGGSTKSTAETEKEMLDKLPEVMGMLSPLLGGEKPTPPETSIPEKSEPAEIVTPQIRPAKYDQARAARLMQALKPYLSEARGEIIDKCLAVLKIGDIVSAAEGLGLLGTLRNN